MLYFVQLKDERRSIVLGIPIEEGFDLHFFVGGFRIDGNGSKVDLDRYFEGKRGDFFENEGVIMIIDAL